MVRFGLLGCGRIGQVHARAIQASPDATLVAVADAFDAPAQALAAATGADLSLMPYYRAFNWFKTACIIHGVYARYRAGKKSTEGVDMDLLHTRIGIALDNADTLAADIL